MSTTGTTKFIFIRGETFTRACRHKQTDGTPINLSGFTVSLKLIDQTPDQSILTLRTGDGATPHGSSIAYTDQVRGEFSFTISVDEINSFLITKGLCRIDLKIGSTSRPLAKGTFGVKQF